MDLMAEVENNRLKIDYSIKKVVFTKKNSVYKCFIDMPIGVDFSGWTSCDNQFWGKYWEL
jgi:hypothetical protein